MDQCERNLWVGIPVGVLGYTLALFAIMDGVSVLTDEGRTLGYRWTSRRPIQGWLLDTILVASVYAGYRAGKWVSEKTGKNCSAGVSQ